MLPQITHLSTSRGRARRERERRKQPSSRGQCLRTENRLNLYTTCLYSNQCYGFNLPVQMHDVQELNSNLPPSRRIVHRLQIRLRWPFNADTFAAKPTPMNWTIPALLGLIPTQNTLQMRTYGAEPVCLSLCIFVNRHRLRGEIIMQHAAGMRGEVFDIPDVGFEIPFVPRVDLDVMLQHAG